MANWWDAAVTGVDWWQRRDAIKDAQQEIDKGYSEGRRDVKKYTDPVWERGLEHGEAYDELGQFEYDFDDYMNSDYVDYALAKGSKETLRTQAAQKGVDSGATLARLQQRAQDEIGSQYEQDWRRQFDAYGANVDYHQFPMEQGAQQGQFAGQYLSDMAIGRGSAYGSMEMANAANNTTAMQNLTGGGEDSPGAISGAVKEVMDATGMSLKDAAGFVASKAGIGIDAVKGIVTAGVNKIAGATWGAFGAGPTKIASTAAASTASGGAATGAAMTAGTWAASVVGGFAILGGVMALNKMLGNDPEVGKMFRNLSKKQDPLSRIYSEGFNETWGGELRNVLERDAAGGRTTGNVSTAAKGMMLSAIIGNMEDVSELKQRDDIDRIVNTMFQSAGSGYQADLKWAKPAGITGATDGLAKLFPNMADDFSRLEGLAQTIRRQESYLNTSTDSWLNEQNQISSINQMQQELVTLRASIRAQLDKRMERWDAQRVIAGEG